MFLRVYHVDHVFFSFYKVLRNYCFEKCNVNKVYSVIMSQKTQIWRLMQLFPVFEALRLSFKVFKVKKSSQIFSLKGLVCQIFPEISEME